MLLNGQGRRLAGLRYASLYQYPFGHPAPPDLTIQGGAVNLVSSVRINANNAKLTPLTPGLTPLAPFIPPLAPFIPPLAPFIPPSTPFIPPLALFIPPFYPWGTVLAGAVNLTVRLSSETVYCGAGAPSSLQDSRTFSMPHPKDIIQPAR